jgi:hypothetical protein
MAKAERYTVSVTWANGTTEVIHQSVTERQAAAKWHLPGAQTIVRDSDSEVMRSTGKGKLVPASTPRLVVDPNAAVRDMERSLQRQSRPTRRSREDDEQLAEDFGDYRHCY